MTEKAPSFTLKTPENISLKRPAKPLVVKMENPPATAVLPRLYHTKLLFISFFENHLNGKKFDFIREIKNYFSASFDVEPCSFYKDGTQRLVRHWETVTKNGGE